MTTSHLFVFSDKKKFNAQQSINHKMTEFGVSTVNSNAGQLLKAVSAICDVWASITATKEIVVGICVFRSKT